MSVRHVSKEIIKLDPRIKFIGILKDGNPEISFSEDSKVDESAIKLSVIQSPHIFEAGKRFTDLGNLESVVIEYDKMKLFNLPLKEEMVIFGTNLMVNDEEIMELVSDHILNFQNGPDVQSKQIKNEDDNKKMEEENLDQFQTKRENIGNSWQNYILNLIEFWKEFTITSIRMNEKMVKEFWKNYKQ